MSGKNGNEKGHDGNSKFYTDYKNVIFKVTKCKHTQKTSKLFGLAACCAM